MSKRYELLFRFFLSHSIVSNKEKTCQSDTSYCSVLFSLIPLFLTERKHVKAIRVIVPSFSLSFHCFYQKENISKRYKLLFRLILSHSIVSNRQKTCQSDTSYCSIFFSLILLFLTKRKHVKAIRVIVPFFFLSHSIVSNRKKTC